MGPSAESRESTHRARSCRRGTRPTWPAEDLDDKSAGSCASHPTTRGRNGSALGGPPDPTPVALAGIVDMRDAAQPRPDERFGPRRRRACDFALPVPGCSENLNRVPLEHVDHPFPRCVKQRVSLWEGPAQSGQNFRKGLGQNFRNPQLPLIRSRVTVEPCAEGAVSRCARISSGPDCSRNASPSRTSSASGDEGWRTSFVSHSASLGVSETRRRSRRRGSFQAQRPCGNALWRPSARSVASFVRSMLHASERQPRGRLKTDCPARTRDAPRALRTRPAGSDPLSIVDYLYLAQLPPLLFASDAS